MKTRHSRRKNSSVARANQSAGRTSYTVWSGGIAALLEEARRQAVRSVNAILTATYWEIGRRIVEFEQQGQDRADYGEVLLQRLGADLTKRFGRGFAWRNLFRMREFYLTHQEILSTLSAKSGQAAILRTTPGQSNILPTVSAKSSPFPIYGTPSRISSVELALYLDALGQAFPLSWSHHVRLLSVEQPEARHFYETESLRGGWSVRQLDRQVGTLFYERTALSKNKAKLLAIGTKARREEHVPELA